MTSLRPLPSTAECGVAVRGRHETAMAIVLPIAGQADWSPSSSSFPKQDRSCRNSTSRIERLRSVPGRAVDRGFH
jgi:hypothetical protein